MASSCGTCLGDLDRAPTTRIGGLDLCDHCARGDLRTRLEARRGWKTEVEQATITVRDVTVYQTRITLSVHGGAGLELRCRRRGWSSDPLGYVLPRLRSGDPLFDGFVNVRSETPRAIGSILARDGFQSIVMDLLGEARLVAFRQRCLSLTRTTDAYEAPERILVKVAVCAAHLDAADPHPGLARGTPA